MHSGNSDMLLLDFADRYGLITAEAAGVLLETNPNAAGKHLARLTKTQQLERLPYIWPRSMWKPFRKLGAQALLMRAPVVAFCLHGQTRWELERWDGPAAICTAQGQREAVFLDLGGTADHVARKLRNYCSGKNLAGFTGLTVLVPTETKGQKVFRSCSNHRLGTPVRCVVVDDLRRLLYETRLHSAS